MQIKLNRRHSHDGRNRRHTHTHTHVASYARIDNAATHGALNDLLCARCICGNSPFFLLYLYLIVAVVCVCGVRHHILCHCKANVSEVEGKHLLSGQFKCKPSSSYTILFVRCALRSRFYLFFIHFWFLLLWLLVIMGVAPLIGECPLLLLLSNCRMDGMPMHENQRRNKHQQQRQQKENACAVDWRGRDVRIWPNYKPISIDGLVMQVVAHIWVHCISHVYAVSMLLRQSTQTDSHFIEWANHKLKLEFMCCLVRCAIENALHDQSMEFYSTPTL